MATWEVSFDTVVLWLKTVGTQLAQRGARLRTIQKFLGHESAAMSLAYLGISDEDVRQDYQAVLGERATIAGPGVEMISLRPPDPIRGHLVKRPLLPNGARIGKAASACRKKARVSVICISPVPSL